MGDVIPFMTEQGRFIERLLLSLHAVARIADTYREMYERTVAGESVGLGNPHEVAFSIAQTNTLIHELREKGYGKLLDGELDS